MPKIRIVFIGIRIILPFVERRITFINPGFIDRFVNNLDMAPEEISRKSISRSYRVAKIRFTQNWDTLPLVLAYLFFRTRHLPRQIAAGVVKRSVNAVGLVVCIRVPGEVSARTMDVVVIEVAQWVPIRLPIATRHIIAHVVVVQISTFTTRA